MKILLATSKAIPSGGGIASYNQELVALLSTDYEIELLTDSDEKEVSGYIKTYTTCGYKNNDVCYCENLIYRINSQNYDCIINSNSSFIPVLSPFLKCPIVSISHFVNGTLAINAGYNAEYLNCIVALSSYGKNFISRKYNINALSKIKVVYNFVKKNDYYNTTKPNREILKIVYPGGTSIKKSVDVVQQLVYRLLSSNLKFEFYWLGGDRLPSANLSILGLKTTQSLFEKDPRLKIMGMVSRETAMDILSDANIFLLPSRGEGCPMTLLEAMRGSCISIVSDAHHGSKEIIELSHAGIITKQDSSLSIFEAIRDIIMFPDKYAKMYNLSRNFIETSVSQDVWGTEMNEIITDSISKGKIYIKFSRSIFKKTSRRFRWLYKIERIKDMWSSAKYRFIIDAHYLKNKFGLY